MVNDLWPGDQYSARSACVQIARASLVLMKNHCLKLCLKIPAARAVLLLLATATLGGCVTHYYPVPTASYPGWSNNGEYAAVTADVPAPSAGVVASNVIYAVDSAYYPWWSLDYLYLGYGYGSGYGWGAGGISIGINLGYPRPWYGWPSYAWYSPWYYPPYYSAWYPSHYWRPYYHPYHHYWSHRHHSNPPYGHRPGHHGYASNDQSQQPRHRDNEWDRTERPVPVSGGAYPAGAVPAAGSLGGRLGSPASPAAARSLTTAYRPPVPSAAEALSARPPLRQAGVAPGSLAGALQNSPTARPGPRVISRSPGFTSNTPVAPSNHSKGTPSSVRVIGKPAYRAPLSRSVQPGSPVSSSPVISTIPGPSARSERPSSGPASPARRSSPALNRPLTSSPAPTNRTASPAPIPMPSSPVRVSPSVRYVPSPSAPSAGTRNLVRPAPTAQPQSRSYVPRSTAPGYSGRPPVSVQRPSVSAPARPAPRARSVPRAPRRPASKPPK